MLIAPPSGIVKPFQGLVNPLRGGLWRGRRFALPLWDGTDVPRDVAEGIDLTKGNSVTWNLGPRGWRLNFDGTSGHNALDLGTDPFGITDALTIAALIYPASNPNPSGGNGRVVSHGNGSTGDHWCLALSSAGAVDFRINNSFQPTSDGVVPLGGDDPVAIVCTYDGANRRVFVNGKLVHTVATTGAISTGQVIRLGAAGSNESRYYVGDLDTIGVWERSFGISEVQEWTADPFADFQPESIHVRLASAGGPTTHQGAITDGVLSGDTFASTVTPAAGITDGAEAGDSFEAAVTLQASITEGSTAGLSFATTLEWDFPDEGAEAGDTQAASLTAQASTSDTTEAGDTEAALLTAQGTLSNATNAGDTFTGTVTVAGALTGAITEGTQATDSFAPLATLQASTTEGAESGDTQAAELTAQASVSDGARAGDSFTHTSTVPGDLTEGAEAGDVQAAIATLLADVNEAALASDSFEASLTAQASWSEGADAGDSWAYVGEEIIGSLSGTVTLAPSLSGTVALSPSLSGTLTLEPS